MLCTTDPYDNSSPTILSRVLVLLVRFHFELLYLRSSIGDSFGFCIPPKASVKPKPSIDEASLHAASASPVADTHEVTCPLQGVGTPAVDFGCQGSWTITA